MRTWPDLHVLQQQVSAPVHTVRTWTCSICCILRVCSDACLHTLAKLLFRSIVAPKLSNFARTQASDACKAENSLNAVVPVGHSPVSEALPEGGVLERGPSTSAVEDQGAVHCIVMIAVHSDADMFSMTLVINSSRIC